MPNIIYVLTNEAMLGLVKIGLTTALLQQYWMFEGELLDERRRRLESEQFDEISSND